MNRRVIGSVIEYVRYCVVAIEELMRLGDSYGGLNTCTDISSPSKTSR